MSPPGLAVLFLIFNEGYLATGDGDPVRLELTGEAIRLTRILRELVPEEPEVALAQVDRLPLTGYHAWHATRADLLRRLGRTAESKASYDAAIAATRNSAERANLRERRCELG